MKLRFAVSAAVAAVSSALVTYIAVAAPFAQPKTTVATQVSYQSTSYTIAPGATQSEILVPVTNRPIHMMITAMNNIDRGVASLTLLRATGGSNNFLQWFGADIASNRTNGPAQFDQGFGATKGAHVTYADYGSTVDVQVQNDSHLQIVNNFNMPMTVVVTFMY
jgi:hypothetical protein